MLGKLQLARHLLRFTAEDPFIPRFFSQRGTSNDSARDYRGPA